MSATVHLQPLRHVETAHLDVAYYEEGPADGQPVLLLHGFPYDIHSYVDVAPLLADAGFRVIVPYLRGHGDTRFLDNTIPRTGQQAALGQIVDQHLGARPGTGHPFGLEPQGAPLAVAALVAGQFFPVCCVSHLANLFSRGSVSRG